MLTGMLLASRISRERSVIAAAMDQKQRLLDTNLPEQQALAICDVVDQVRTYCDKISAKAPVR